jgi:acyl-CoA synthetase (AMP-forming)/AMP-acid ligase II
MLYDRWREIVREFAADTAVHDVTSRRRWTFAQLDALTASAPVEAVVFPQGPPVEFITAVLNGWKFGAVVCALEPGQAPPEFPAPPKNIVHLKITSASTGAARLVAFTAEQLAADARNIIDTMGLRREWPNLAAISLAHSYGFSNLITPLLLHGIPLVITNSPLPQSVAAAMRELPAVTLPGVPALWRAWFDAGVLATENVRLAISAGAPLPISLERDVFARSGIKIHNFYGSTECGGIAYDSSDNPRVDISHVGQSMKNVRLAVAGDGCLEVLSAAVGETYWPEANDRLAHRRFHTTDLAEINGGNVYLRGRASDVINVAGRKVSPETIEAALLKHPGVRQCAVFGVPDGDRERIIACVAAEPSVNPQNLQHFLFAHLPDWQVPRDFWFVEELPTDHRGKLPRAAMRDSYLRSSRRTA